MCENLINAIAKSQGITKTQAAVSLLRAIRAWQESDYDLEPDEIVFCEWNLDADWALDFLHAAESARLDE